VIVAAVPSVSRAVSGAAVTGMHGRCVLTAVPVVGPFRHVVAGELTGVIPHAAQRGVIVLPDVTTVVVAVA
jgi:hypothetical protein